MSSQLLEAALFDEDSDVDAIQAISHIVDAIPAISHIAKEKTLAPYVQRGYQPHNVRRCIANESRRGMIGLCE